MIVRLKCKLKATGRVNCELKTTGRGNCELKTTGRGLWAERPGASRLGALNRWWFAKLRSRSSGMQDFKKLEVWQKAHALSLCIDRTCKRVRAAQYSSLRNQLFRAATSVPANIAEGRRQSSDREFGRFLRIALNSSSELEHHLIFARDAKVIQESEFVSLVSQTITVRKMLYAFLKCLAVPEPEAGRRSETRPSPKPPAAPSTAPGR